MFACHFIKFKNKPNEELKQQCCYLQGTLLSHFIVAKHSYNERMKITQLELNLTYSPR